MTVLRRLLGILNRGQTCTTAGLARELGVSPCLVEQMLSDLERAGYLRNVNTCAPDACGGCAHTGACSPTTLQMWVVIKGTGGQ